MAKQVGMCLACGALTKPCKIEYAGAVYEAERCKKCGALYMTSDEQARLVKACKPSG